MLTLGNQMTGLPQYLGGRWLRFEPGQLWAEADLASQTPTPPATWHGGAIAAILDHITGAVVYRLIPDGHWGATTELKLNYVAPITPGLVQAQASGSPSATAAPSSAARPTKAKDSSRPRRARSRSSAPRVA